jgi:predicted lysophospholipase L1 biosynthesis ABC-type transport system permease subunit
MRLVWLIGVVKWIALALVTIAALISFGASAQLANSLDAPEVGALGLLGLLYGGVVGLLVYLFFSWLQQTLLMLVGIAKNTAVPDYEALSRL